MFGPNFNDYYREALEKVSQEIQRETDSQIIGSDIEQLAKFYFQKYALTPIVFDPADITYNIRKEMRRIPADRREWGYQNEGDIDWEYEIADIVILIQPNNNLDWIKKLGTPTRYLDGFDESLKYGSGRVSHSFDIKGYGFNMDEDRIANEINSKSQRLIEAINRKNSNIESENASFLQSIKQLIDQKRLKIEADKSRLDSLTRKINIPLKRVAEATITKIHISPKEFVRVEKPTPTLPEQFIFDEAKLTPILQFVDFQMQSLERTPSSVKNLGEVELRDLTLSALNGAFQGDATAETFVKKGKTDIHLKIQKGEILIFECKIWDGEKVYTSTIDQLIGYVTWRQNYGVIIMFCRNKDFSKILAQIPTIIQNHPRFRGGFKKMGSAHFVSEHSFPEDIDKTIKIHHLIYNLFSE